MSEIDSIRIHFSEDHKIIMNLCLAFVMFGVALNISPADFKRVAKFPKAILVGLSSQWIILPVMTVYLIHLWPVKYASVALGLLLVASCPGGNMSNFMTQYGKGNTALSITLTSVVSLFSPIYTPLAFVGFAYFVPQTADLFESIRINRGEVIMTLIMLLAIPLTAGLAAGHFLPKLTKAIQKPVQRISLLIFITFIVFAFLGNWNIFVQHIHLVLWLVITHNVLAMIAGYVWAKWNKLPTADAKAISMETGIQNSGLGLALIMNFFPNLGGMMLVTAFWAVWDLVSSLLVAQFWKFRAGEKL